MRGVSWRLSLLAGMLAFSLAACGNTVSVDVRPNRPTPGASSAAASSFPSGSISLASLPGYTAPAFPGDGVYSRPMTGSPGSVRWQVFDANSRPLTPYQPADSVAWGAASDYTKIPGVLAWRGNNARTAPTYGTANVTAKKLQVVWTQPIGAVKADGSYFPGAGWTGQPLLVNWPNATKKAMGLAAKYAEDPGFVEVVYPVFDGNIYRLDLATGAQTRAPIVSGWGFKGTGSIDPRGYPLLYAGQGLNQNGSSTGPWEYRIFDLIQNKQISQISGTDEVSHRAHPTGWGAFDSSALVNATSDTLIEPGENGVIYKVKLNSHFDAEAKKVSISPQVTKMVYSTPNSEQYGIESSSAAWHNLMWATDNDGNLICWDANTLQILWSREVVDNDDSTVVLDDSTGVPYLYTGNSVGQRGAQRSNQVTSLRKVNGLTGQIMWQYELPSYYDFAVKGGLLSTPLLGQGEDADMVIFNVGKTTSPSEGTLVALDKASGTVIWSRSLAHYSWSSPVMIHGTDGHEYGVFGDSAGLLHLFDPATGTDYSTVDLGMNVEASVAAYGNMIVIASYDQKIFGIKLT